MATAGAGVLVVPSFKIRPVFMDVTQIVSTMFSLLLYAVVLALPVFLFRYNLRLRNPYDVGMVCLATLIVGAVLLWANIHLLFAELHPEFTAINAKQLAAHPNASEFSPEGRASRTLHTFSILVVGFAVLWYFIVCTSEIVSGVRRQTESQNTQSRCTDCGHVLEANIALSGLEGNCPKCGTTFTFPVIEPPAVGQTVDDG